MTSVPPPTRHPAEQVREWLEEFRRRCAETDTDTDTEVEVEGRIRSGTAGGGE